MSTVSRRKFLSMVGASFAATLVACTPAALPTAAPVAAPAKETQPTKPAAPVAKPAAKAPIKITVCDLIADDATGPRVFNRVKYEEFAETFPEYEVEHIANPDVGFEKRKEYWLTAYAPGGPNAMMGDTNKWAWEFATVGKALILDDYIPLYFQEDWDSMVDAVKKCSTYDSHVVQIPGMIEVHGLCVRRAHLEEVGYDVDYAPKNWIEFTKMVKDLTNENHYGWQWKTYMRAMSEFLHMNGDEFATQNPDRTIELHYTRNELVEVLEFLKSLIYPERYAQENVLQDFTANLNAFQQGQSSTFNMMPSWTAWIFGVTDFSAEDLNWFNYPIGPTGEAGDGLRPAYVDVGTHSWVANAHGTPEQNQAVAHYLCWMNSKENIKKQAVWWEDNELLGVYASPFKDVPWNTVSVGIPDWWGPTLDGMLKIGDVHPAPDYIPARTYVDAACAEIVNDPNSDVRGILQAAEDKTKSEFLDQFHAKLRG